MPTFMLQREDGSLVRDDDGDVIVSAHMRTARAHAIITANIEREPITVGSIRGMDDDFKPRIVIQPDGQAKPPKGMKSGEERTGDCRASDDGPACFCPNCRAARRAAR